MHINVKIHKLGRTACREWGQAKIFDLVFACAILHVDTYTVTAVFKLRHMHSGDMEWIDRQREDLDCQSTIQLDRIDIKLLWTVYFKRLLRVQMTYRRNISLEGWVYKVWSPWGTSLNKTWVFRAGAMLKSLQLKSRRLLYLLYRLVETISA